MLTYADGKHSAVRLPHCNTCNSVGGDRVGWTSFAGVPVLSLLALTGTKLQALTPEELQGYEGLHNEGSQVANSILTFDEDSVGWSTVLNLLVL
jgi:hypothetical protein